MPRFEGNTSSAYGRTSAQQAQPASTPKARSASTAIAQTASTPQAPPIPAPQGRPSLAQRFSAGNSSTKHVSPGGTTPLARRPNHGLRRYIAAVLFVTLLAPAPLSAQALAKRLILKDGSYQLASKYEIKGERVRYFSAERGEWEEIPRSLIDWDATEKYEQGRLQGAPSPEAVQLDKELDAEMKAEEARSPQVAPGLRLPADGGVFLLDTFQNQPQIDELQQSGGEVNRNTKSNILRAAINPFASARQTIELPGERAKIQSHTGVPAIYVNIDVQDAATGTAGTQGEPPLPSALRFKLVHAEVKNGKRIVGGIKIAPYGKVKADDRFVAAIVQELSGGWIKVTPKEPLPNGEYAIAEMLGKEGMNLYVWDFGVDPSAPANPFAWKPDVKEPQKKPEQPEELKKREKE